MPSSTEGQLILGSPDPSNSNSSDDGSDMSDARSAAAPEQDSLHGDELDLESVDSPAPLPTGSGSNHRGRARGSSVHRGRRSAPRAPSRPPRAICQLLQDASLEEESPAEAEAEARRRGLWPLHRHGGPPPHGRPRSSPSSSPAVPAAALLFHPHPCPLAMMPGPGFPVLPPNAEQDREDPRHGWTTTAMDQRRASLLPSQADRHAISPPSLPPSPPPEGSPENPSSHGEGPLH